MTGGGRGGYGKWVLHPVQRGLPHSCLCPVWPVSCPRMPMAAHVFRPDKHLCQQTAVTPPVRPLSPALLCNYTPAPAVEGAGGGSQTEMQTPSLPSASLQACAGKTERVREVGRVSEREGEVKTALSGTERRGRAGRPSSFLWKIRGCVREHIWMGWTSWNDWCENQQSQAEED